jgi:hypothetical protein
MYNFIDGSKGIFPELQCFLIVTSGELKISNLISILYLSEWIFISFRIFKLFIDFLIFINDIFKSIFTVFNQFSIGVIVLEDMLLIISKFKEIFMLLFEFKDDFIGISFNLFDNNFTGGDLFLEVGLMLMKKGDTLLYFFRILLEL